MEMHLSRRRFIQAAAAMGAAFAWSGSSQASRTGWHERRDLFPEGVASGDPDSHSVMLWTRRPFEKGEREMLAVEVAEDDAFRRVVAHAKVPVYAAADWTARVLVGGLKPARTYWYRFSDEQGNGSRIGRTITAPAANDPRAVNFAFVSCQDVNEGKLNAYRRMIFEDERARRPNSSASCCTSATSSTRWSISDEGRPATTARSTRSRASPTAARSATSTSR
jgi:alkaline phosphatase D